MDDRGLLDGGGIVPKYYTSHRQRQRRYLELRPRVHRVRDKVKVYRFYGSL